MSPGITFGSITTPFTVESWFYANANPIASRIVLLGSGGTGEEGSGPWLNNGLSILTLDNTQWKVDSSGVAQQPYIFPALLQNVWYYIAITRDTSGYVQMWLGTTPGGTATASSTGRQLLTAPDWDLTTPTYVVGTWPNTSTYNNNTFINNLRVTNTNLFSTNASTIPIPTANLTNVTGTQLLINDGDFVDQSGTQTLTQVCNMSSSMSNPFS